MKLIPKYLLPANPIISVDKTRDYPWVNIYWDLNKINNSINWGKDWYSATYDPEKRQYTFGSPWLGGRNSGSRPYYGFNKNISKKDVGTLENSPAYRAFGESLTTNGGSELTSHGINTLDGLLQNSNPTSDIYKTLSSIKNNKYLFPLGGVQLGNGLLAKNFEELFNHYRYDKNPAMFHNLNKGTAGWWEDENGNYNLITDNDGQFVRKDIQDEDRNKIMLKFTPYGNLITFEEYERNPSVNTGPLPDNENIKLSSNITDYPNSGEVNTELKSQIEKEGETLNDNILKWNKTSGVVGDPAPAGDGGGGNGDKTKKDKISSLQDKIRMSSQVLDGLRVLFDNMYNTKVANQLIKERDVALKNTTPIGRKVFGDYVALLQGLNQAARLTNRLPLTSNAQIEHAAQLEAISKGNQYIDLGNQRDAQMYWNTSERAFQLARENVLKTDDYANYNRTQLANFRNENAKIRFDTKVANMQNMDDYISDRSAELLLDEAYRKAEDLKSLRAYKSWYMDYNGVDTTTYDDLTTQILNEQLKPNPDRDLIILLLKLRKNEYDLIQAQRAYNSFKIYGWPIEQWESYYGNKFKIDEKTGRVVSIAKNGGLLNFLQRGGFVRFNRTKLTSPYDFLGRDSARSYNSEYGSESKKKDSGSSSSEDSDEKSRQSLFKSITETLKGVDGLNSDVAILSNELLQFFDLLRYSIGTDLDSSYFYSTYVRALTRLNLVKQSAKQFDTAYKTLESNKAITSPAIDKNGMLVVGIGGTQETKRVSAEEYLLDRKSGNPTYLLLTNDLLLYLRKNSPTMAFNDTLITEIAYNGTSIQLIQDYIKKFITGLGQDEVTRDSLTRNFGGQASQGILMLQDLLNGKLTDAETATILSLVQGIGEYTVTQSSQAGQILAALYSILAFLPANMRTYLTLYAGGKEDAEKAILSLIVKDTGTKTEFKFNGFTSLDENGNPTSSSKSGSGSGGSGSSGEEAEERKLLNIVEMIGGTYDNLIINPGTKSELSVGAVTYNFPEIALPSSLSVALRESTIVTLADTKNVYFGDLKIAPEKLQDVAYLGYGLSAVLLPIKRDGSPDFDLFLKFEQACNEVRAEGKNPMDIKDEEALKLLAKKLEGTGLYNLVRGSMPDLSKIGLFLVTEGLTSSKAGVKKSLFVRVKEDADYNFLRRTLGGKDVNGKWMDYELDEPEIWNPADWSFLGGSSDIIYEGTIYIPYNNNPLQATTGSGNKRKQSAAIRQEQAYQASENLRKYNGDNQLKQ